MSFHQNGLTMTFFARDYTVPSVGKFTNLWFDLFTMLPIFLSVFGLVYAVRKSVTANIRLIGLAAFVGFGLLAYYRFSGFADTNPFTPQNSSISTFFIGAYADCTGIFRLLRDKVRNLSPRKIGYGMIPATVFRADIAHGTVIPEGAGGGVKVTGLTLLAHFHLFYTHRC
jgi:POT family proton-dependent oligopeptide transporter